MDVVLRQLPMREREVFESMRLNVQLAPGEMLVLDEPARRRQPAGPLLPHGRSADGRQQKMVLIRLAEVPQSDTFAELVSD